MNLIKILPKKYLVLLAIVAVLFILIVVGLVKTPSDRNTSSNRDPLLQNLDSTNTLVEVTPNVTTPLYENTTPEFVLRFGLSLNPELTNISIKQKDLSNDSTEVESSFTIKYFNNNKQLNLSLNEKILPYHQYRIIITNKQNNAVLTSLSYLSSLEEPSPVPTNNVELRNYLPHREKNYSLVYLPYSNLYVFHFAVDPENNQDLETQFNRAKQDAIEFIRSKNIAPESVIIEWRYN